MRGTNAFFRRSLMMVLAASCSLASLGQNARQDSIPASMRVGIKNSGVSLRAGIGIQRSFYYEIGFARNTFVASRHGGQGSSIYAAFASFPAFHERDHTVSGFRFGTEFYGTGGFIGVEVSPLWGGHRQDILIAPKIGFGVPTTSLFYAYHFSTNEWAVARVGRHQIGLQVAPYLWRHDKLQKTKHWFWQRHRRM